MPTVIVIGESRGLGHAVAGKYLTRGWDIIATVRQLGGFAGVDEDRLLLQTVDTTDWAGVDALD